METYKIIKKFLTDGGNCLLIEDGKPVGVVLSVEEYEFLQNKIPTQNSLLVKDLPKGDGPQTKEEKSFVARPVEAVAVASNPIGEAMAKEMNFSGLPFESAKLAEKTEASAEIADIEAIDDVTLKDLGIDELPY